MEDVIVGTCACRRDRLGQSICCEGGNWHWRAMGEDSGRRRKLRESTGRGKKTRGTKRALA